MALQYTVRPISDRSPFTGKHTDSQFTITWSGALDLLQREYEQLKGRQLVIEVDVEERGIRNDGLLRADAQARTPAARVAFESKHGPITMATDRFLRPSYKRESMQSWQHNVYAIAKSLEALRMVDRYGVTKRGEQYTGWKAIGSAPVALGGRPTLTRDEAVTVIAGFAELRAVEVVANPSGAVRVARGKAHPDRHGGNRTAWDQLEAAVQTLGGAS